MLERLPDGVTTDGDLVPGGDIRIKGNAWIRSSFRASGLSKVPRESQLRFAVRKILKKKALATHWLDSATFKWFQIFQIDI